MRLSSSSHHCAFVVGDNITYTPRCNPHRLVLLFALSLLSVSLPQSISSPSNAASPPQRCAWKTLLLSLTALYSLLFVFSVSLSLSSKVDYGSYPS
ncbi:hypothetical protein L6164_001408 [Bauhinia variegata]|uniref:Uncharacterized protein n=1 Tax=Bauhinia variegata TaxID=167791 RepID=A0ACB9Q8X9_BAUVA|nr:hypothetical protein L6164_001408 [Bauhinia variegata]